MTALAPALSPDHSAALNARARRSVLRITGTPHEVASSIPDDALLGFIADLRLEVDAVGDLRQAWACADGRLGDAEQQEAWPDALSPDRVFTFTEED